MKNVMSYGGVQDNITKSYIGVTNVTKVSLISKKVSRII